ncbi:MAG: ATP-grasp domain-containing protein [Candidatus Omnitrophica bacterium]|nr:ATP-grasp domain-containing protein [Candidatus Omnitrophota bacterium]
MGFRVGLTYNVKTEYVFRPGDPPDANAEFDHPDTIGVIEQAIRAGGHEVVRFGNARSLLERLDDLKRVDIVFNIAEGFEGRNRESQVPIILEMMHVPFVGADGLSLGLTLDKIITKKILMAEGIPTPRFTEIADPDKSWQVDLAYPLIAKPRYEGSSKGLRKSSLVTTPLDLARQAQWLIDTYRQPALVEEFIEGQEVTVPIIGNDPPLVQPIAQIQIEGTTDLGRLFYTFDHIRSGADYVCPAPIDEGLRKELESLALKTYLAVECRDFGRIDIRVDRAGRPYVLEINPLPSLSTEDVFMCVAKALGLPYEAIINQVLDAALVRAQLIPPPAGSAGGRRALPPPLHEGAGHQPLAGQQVVG